MRHTYNVDGSITGCLISEQKMVRSLPPLNSLRAFEAAASQLSFTLAAEELNVTQAAISHQVKSLEESLGVPLFSRFNRKLQLTDEGRAYLPAVRAALDGIADATMHIREERSHQIITVSTMDSFAADWLVPRLKHFNDAHPDTDVWITTWNPMERLRRDNVDVEIRYGDGRWPDDDVTMLLKEDIFPVCSPQLIKDKTLNSPSDLAGFTLLHDLLLIGWADWLKAAGVEDVDASHGPHFNHSHLMIRAAIQGEGVGLGRGVLVAGAIADGLLVKPFDIDLQGEYAYYVVCRPGATDSPKIAAFHQWLQDEAEADQAPLTESG